LVQFGSASYSPRITRIFAQARVLRHSLGIFTGTFLYSLMAMRMIGMEQTEQVSGLTIWLGFLWLLGSVAILAKLVSVFTTLTVTNVLSALGKVGRTAVAGVYPPFVSAETRHSHPQTVSEKDNDGDTPVHHLIYNGDPGYVVAYNTGVLVAYAAETGTLIELPYAVGDALKDGAPMALIRGRKAAVSRARIYAGIMLGRERAFHNDPKYAIRLLVDTAIRALSPAVNDPTTAVQALDHIESLLKRLGNSNLKIGEAWDASGVLRVVCKVPTWEDYLQLGLSEIMQYGATSIQVERRLEALFRFLQDAVPPERAEAVARFSEHRRSLAASSFGDKTFREWAAMADREGIGSQSNGLSAREGSGKMQKVTAP
ncbi:MAG: DUF2254 domain-containing protein, partial [Chitinivibrionales bacterium]|nr:DUF2254 domain-containing protein [Chitinivibrionales bacterium]